MTSRVAVVTLAHGRYEHLSGQLWGLRHQRRSPDIYVAVAVEDAGIAGVVAEGADPTWEVCVPEVPSTPAGLPLAAARNAGARAALEAGADVLVFLDVDCIPAPTLVGRYATALRDLETAGARRPVVAAGEVGYLPPVEHPRAYRDGRRLATLARPHPARPVLAAEEVRVAEDLRLFWSLSFAMTAGGWDLVGGFCEDYVGYGGEDTDFGQLVAAADGRLVWVGGAAAYHQHHETHSPPVQHLEAVVTNANLFATRWGWFPMEGWLDRFAELGLARRDPGTGTWRVLVEARSPGTR